MSFLTQAMKYIYGFSETLLETDSKTVLK